jgi:carbonic anhydrase/acetyltransferase-like protein (isoleucine patch superfamily)
VPTIAARPPAHATLRHRLRARRAAVVPGVSVEGAPLLGRGVVLDVSGGAHVTLEDGCVLLDGCRIHARDRAQVRIGARALLGERCVVLAHERVEVGHGAVLGDGAVLVDFAHAHADVERPVRLQGLQTSAVVVGDGARVGAGAVVERGARVTAGRPVPANSVVGPA